MTTVLLILLNVDGTAIDKTSAPLLCRLLHFPSSFASDHPLRHTLLAKMAKHVSNTLLLDLALDSQIAVPDLVSIAMDCMRTMALTNVQEFPGWLLEQIGNGRRGGGGFDRVARRGQCGLLC